MKKNLNAIIFALAIVLSAMFLGKSYVDRMRPAGNIQVTGLGKVNFESDLIVWEGNFRTIDKELKNAYLILDRHKQIIKEYLKDKGVSEDEFVFKAVSVRKEVETKYSKTGEYLGQNFIGYGLTQSIVIESQEVDKIEKISREITELLNKGVEFYSNIPRYYYTKLADLKIEMISKATENGRIRAEKIAEFSGGQLDKLDTAKMGVFQITGQNSEENYSWGGAFNTSSRKKTASITMKLVYKSK